MTRVASTPCTTTARFIGTTDDVVECERCGKPDLRATVILELLDADGNGEGIAYYGSTCAARALTDRGERTTGARVLKAARAARARTLDAADLARERLANYGLPVDGEPTPAELERAALRFATWHSHARWAATADWTACVDEMLADARRCIAEAALLERAA